MKAFLIILLSITILVPCQAQKVRPVLNLTSGGIYYTVNNVSSTITQTIKGQQMNYIVGFTNVIAFKVTGIKDTVYNMEVSYKAIDVRMQTPGGATELNSNSKDPQDLPSKMVAQMVDKPFLVSLSKTGKVLSVKNIERIIDDIVNSSAVVDTLQRLQLRNQLAQTFGQESFKGTLEASLSIYPSGSVSRNDKWHLKTKMQNPAPSEINSVYQLQDITPTYYLIHGDAKMATLNTDAPTMLNGMPVKYNLTGTIASDIKVSKKSGWIIEARIKQDVTGNLEIMDNTQIPGGMVIPMDIHSNIVTTNR